MQGRKLRNFLNMSYLTLLLLIIGTRRGVKKKTASFTGDAKLGGVANISKNRDNTEEQKVVTNTGRK